MTRQTPMCICQQALNIEMDIMQLSEEQLRSRRSRSKAIAWALIGFMVLVFIVTIVKLSGNVALRPF